MSETDIPFIAEMVEVKVAERHWYRAIERAIGSERLRILVFPLILHEWRQSRYQEFASRNVWSLFNAFTETRKGNLTELPRRTEALHGLLDNHVGLSA